MALAPTSSRPRVGARRCSGSLAFGVFAVFALGAAPPEKAADELVLKPTRPWSGATARRCAEVEDVIRRVGKRHGVDPGLLAGIAKHESRFKVDAKNPRSSATGLMQILKSTRRRLKCGGDMRRAEPNLDCGARLLAGWLRYYKGNVIHALSGYGVGFKAPNAARRNATFPRNIRFIERVLRNRAAFIRHGCGTP